MEIVIVERSLGGAEDMEVMEQRDEVNQACFEMRNVTRLRSFISKDLSKTVCVYAAPDAATVREANERAGLAFDRVWTAVEDVPKDGV